MILRTNLRQAWAYDSAGNRTVDQTDDVVFATSHDNLNRLGARAPGGPIVFSGSLNEAGTVTIEGKPAEVDASNNFRGTATLSGATTTVTVKAKDASGNETTKQYEVDTSGSTTSYAYDANGNLTSDGTKTYLWNALDQLVEVKQGTTGLVTFNYDGDGRRTEKSSSGVTRVYVYDSEDIVEERVSGTAANTIRYFHGIDLDEPLAHRDSGNTITYYLADHLGSIVEETNASGTVQLEREHDPWGRPLSAAAISGYSFTGREFDAETGLHYYRARYYDSASAQWTADDLVGVVAGPNLRAYVSNAPLSFTDPSGLAEKGKRNISVNHKGEVLTKQSPLDKVTEALKDAIKNKMSTKHITSLRGLMKVIRRGGMQGALLPLCIVYDCEELYNQFDQILHPPVNKCIA